MRPGTVHVKIGDRVHVGEILGHVGSTGSSTEPHLHVHIDDQPSFLAGNGVPYALPRARRAGPSQPTLAPRPPWGSGGMTQPMKGAQE